MLDSDNAASQWVGTSLDANKFRAAATSGLDTASASMNEFCCQPSVRVDTG